MNQIPHTAPRKGASRMADISPDVLNALEKGEISTATLSESLALDQGKLLQAVFPLAEKTLSAEISSLGSMGILRRTSFIGELLLTHYGPEVIPQCQTHPADTVRGWACFMVGILPNLSLEQRLQAIRPLADDPHFGVREWAWLAVRNHLPVNLEAGIALLSAWTTDPSERIRRFACEATRPRGVWCAHIPALKKNPELGLPILEPLRADSSEYVQNSVGNWLNDAGKSRPDWVQQLCERWMEEQGPLSTRKICSRAVRNLK